jgi:ligand-binding sensor domain-containing protein
MFRNCSNLSPSKIVLFISSLIITHSVAAQIVSKNGWRLDANPLPNLRSNYVQDIVIHRGDIWLGAGKGLSRSRDGGKSWVTYTTADGLPRGGISALAVTDSIIWVAGSFDSLTIDAGVQPTGSGLSYSLDAGQTWMHAPQFGATPVQNVIYDIALRENQIWAASYGSGLQLSINRAQTFTVVPPDTFLFDAFGNLNHRVFSVINADGVLWAGTAGGINKSLDGGKTWANFSHTNQARPISGNFVGALAQQKWRGREYIWAATRQAVDLNEIHAVSISDDGGYSWRVALASEFSHNFAFDDSMAYVVSDNGLFKSNDFGYTWAKFAPIVDMTGSERFLDTKIYAVAAANGRVWASGPDGLAYTDDNGVSWKILRGTTKAGENNEPRTFAYPNPFSPFRHNQFRDDGHVRFQYQTTRATKVMLKVFDFAMDLVAEVVSQKERPVPGQYAEVWNGRNNRGDIVANGVYFYRLELEGEGAFWGKVMVLD